MCKIYQHQYTAEWFLHFATYSTVIEGLESLQDHALRTLVEWPIQHAFWYSICLSMDQLSDWWLAFIIDFNVI